MRYNFCASVKIVIFTLRNILLTKTNEADETSIANMLQK